MPCQGSAPRVGTGGEGVTSIRGGQFLTWSGPGCGDSQGTGLGQAEATLNPSSLVSPVPCKVPAIRLGALSAYMTLTAL